MEIPSYALALIERLEATGRQAWAVGGCVRDSFLGLAPHDWDLCTDATPPEMKAVFRDHELVLNGEKHGTVGVITGGTLVEITTFRSEGGYTDARHPQWVRFETNIAADLSRRDFTVNAMAYHPVRGLADPWGGKKDLDAGILRAVGQPEKRFQEDGLRILRGIRFAARFGLKPEEETLNAMIRLAPSLSLQARERVFAELCGFLLAAGTEDLITFAPILTAAIEPLSSMVGFSQNNPHHIYDVYTHTAHAVGSAIKSLPVRWAALLHDVAKPLVYEEDTAGIGHFYGHAKLGAEIARSVLRELRAPKALQDEVSTLVACHGTCRDLGQAETDKPIRRLLRRLGPDSVRHLLALDRADNRGKGTPTDMAALDRFESRLETILTEPPCRQVTDLAIGGRALLELGVEQGPHMGRLLNRLLDEVTDGMLPNEAALLLARAKELIEQEKYHVYRKTNDRHAP